MATAKKTTKKEAPAQEVIETPAPASEEVAETPAPAFEERMVVCDGYVSLNVRPKPSFGGKPVRTIPNRSKVEALPAVDGWCELKDGGYVKAEFLV